MSTNLPFEIPPFDPGNLAPKRRWDWWGWNPNYPYWSRSCWGGQTEDEARNQKEHYYASCYAIALVKEDCGVFTVIEMHPPTDAEAWDRIAKQRGITTQK